MNWGEFFRWFFFDDGWALLGLFAAFIVVVVPLGIESMLDRGDAGSGSHSGGAGMHGPSPAGPGCSSTLPSGSAVCLGSGGGWTRSGTAAAHQPGPGTDLSGGAR